MSLRRREHRSLFSYQGSLSLTSFFTANSTAMDDDLLMNDTLTALGSSIPPDWCFNVEVWLQQLAPPNIASTMTIKYAHYRVFSFRYNGVFTLILIILGLIGSSLLLRQIYGSRLFSKRLVVHLMMICFWDIFYLLCCLVTYCLPSLMFENTPIYGGFSYVLFFLQPFASFCVSCTIWQVFAITLERYLAVSSPLEQRTRKAKFGVVWICIAITTGAFILNLLPIPFEYQLVPCYEIIPSDENGVKFVIHTMLKPYSDNIGRIYKFVVHFFPDLLFRAPLPIIIIGTLTVKTIQACNQRTVGNFQIGMRFSRNLPLRLLLLNFKFILCNTLYMFNTILLELLGYGDMENGDWDGYINSIYLTDASNMLLVIHSATNWLLFYHLPAFQKREPTSMTMSTSIKQSSVKARVAEHIYKQVDPIQHVVGIEILEKIFEEIPEIRDSVFEEEEPERDAQTIINNVGPKVGNFVHLVFKWFAERNRRSGRKPQWKHLTSDAELLNKLQFKAWQWKQIRCIVVQTLVKHVTKDPMPKLGFFTTEEVEECTTRVFNHILSEMRSGVICANVEQKQKLSRVKRSQHLRSNSTGTLCVSRDPPRKSHSVSIRFQYSSSVESVKAEVPAMSKL